MQWNECEDRDLNKVLYEFRREASNLLLDNNRCLMLTENT